MELFEVRKTAVELLAQHGLWHWRVVFNQAKTRAGRCLFHSHEISLSAPLMRMQDLSSPTSLVTLDGAEDGLRVGGDLGLEGELLAVDLDGR